MDEVTVTDSKKNRKLVEGTMEGFVVKKVSVGTGFFKTNAGSIRVDSAWAGKQVLCVLLEKLDA